MLSNRLAVVCKFGIQSGDAWSQLDGVGSALFGSMNQSQIRVVSGLQLFYPHDPLIVVVAALTVAREVVGCHHFCGAYEELGGYKRRGEKRL